VKIAIIGANGHIGSRLLQEALNRGHDVTAIVRDPSKVKQSHPHLKVVKGDALVRESILKLADGHDVLISSYNPGFGPNDDQSLYSVVARTLIDVMKTAKIGRLLIVGGAGSLEATPGVRLYDTPQFPDEYRTAARELGKSLDIYRASDVNWTFVSPAIVISPGTRTGHYRTGTESPVFNEKGESTISTEDFAIALIDEIEKPKFLRMRFTLAY